MKITLPLTTILVLSLLSTQALANENQFVSPTLGLKITKPASWHFVSANAYLENMKQIKWDDPELQEHWNQALRAPVVVMSQFPSTQQGLNPNFKVDVKPYGVIPAGLSGQEILAKMIPAMGQRVKNFRIDTAPVEVTLGGQRAGYAKLTYVSTSTTGASIDMTLQMWSIPMKSYVYLIGATYAPNSRTSEAEVRKIAQSITIE